VRFQAIVTTPQAFLRGLLANYVADAILRSPAVLGSLQILGSPTALLSRVLSGVKDLVMLPAAGTGEGPFAVLSGKRRWDGLYGVYGNVVYIALYGVARRVWRGDSISPGWLVEAPQG
jgi:hypothetical protein